MPTFRQSNGLSAYALACGYIQRAAYSRGEQPDLCPDYELRVDLYHEGACYHVRAHEHAGRGRLSWESFDTLGAARKAWQRAVAQRLGDRIRAAKADRRYWVSREHTGEADPYYVARIEGSPRQSWIGKSATEAGAWLLVAADKDGRA